MANAFHAIAPQSAASTSSPKKPCHDVFINHRGKDVKHKLASTIYNMLDLMGVQVFLDQDELELGDFFPQAIEEAMRSASVHIAILSPSYAESPWCLEELSLMLRINVAIIPVFYGVDPSDLRYVEKGKGKYADAFRQHEIKRRYNPKKIKEWEEALSRVSYLNGAILDAHKGDEGKLLREIVDAALHKMKKVPLEVAMFPVGLDEVVQDFESKVGSSAGSENVHIVGIVGMGGAGKTTLAKELYNRKCSVLSRSSFLCNVRDAASKNTLHELQRNLLRDLRIQHSEFHDTHQGMGMLARGLRSMTVLIVLDDVARVDQMEALLPQGMMGNLGRGSFIIVTTREVDVLTSWGISSVYHMKRLDYSNAKLLFCRHAFLQPYSQLGSDHLLDSSHKFQDLIEGFVEACKGLPLSLKVLGAMVNRHSEAYWEDQLLKISRILPEEIGKHLRVSYDALDREVRQMFLDVACFFIGERKSLVVPIWDGAGWSGEVGWDTLVNKCLVGLDKYGNIEMHDHLRDLGREIAENVSPSRIWKKEQKSNLEVRAQIRGIVLNGIGDSWSTFDHCMENIRPLQVLTVRGNNFREKFAPFSRDLVWLRWSGFDGTNFPSRLSLGNLTVLQLFFANNLKELWRDNVQFPFQLRVLSITYCPQLEQLPNICQLSKLETLVIRNAKNLKELWQDNVQLPLQLRELSIDDCPQLEELPGLTTLVSLRKLELNRTGLWELPNNICQLSKLETLVIGSGNLTSLPESLCELSSLTSLEVRSCWRLESLPETFGGGLGIGSSSRCNLNSLKRLELTYTLVCRISISDDCCPNLENLVLWHNACLTDIQTLPRNVREIDVSGCFRFKNTRGICGLPNLQSLRVDDCPSLEVLPCFAYMHSVRREIYAFGRSSWGCNLESLKYLSLILTGVRRISICNDCCPNLETLVVWINNDLTEIETLPGNVRTIGVDGCEKLKSMRAIGGLLNLQSLVVRSCPDLEVLPCPAYMHSAGHMISITHSPKIETVEYNII